MSRIINLLEGTTPPTRKEPASNGAPAGAPAGTLSPSSTKGSPATVQEMVALAERQLRESDQQLASLTAARASQIKRLEALREGHALAQEVGRAQAELAQCQQRAQTLQQRIEEAQFRLAQTLSAIGGIHE